MLQALRRAGIQPEREFEQRGAHGREEARDMAIRLMTLSRPPTAIFAASDNQAMGVLEAATALGLRVPEDLAVIGFDDVDVATVIGLTTVRQPLFESGILGAELLLAAIEGVDRAPARELAALTLIERRTT
jgi:DNA-binding LacI/PurR family transcriptional regulator